MRYTWIKNWSISWLTALLIGFAVQGIAETAAAQQGVRPPAVPLVACDPYFSVWSPADRLSDGDTVHWTGKPHRLTSLVRIDGKAFRLMGTQPETVAAANQKSLLVLPTRTIYEWEQAGVSLQLTFLTASLPDDIDVLSRPVTYLTYEARSTDGKPHDVSVYFDVSPELAVNTPDQLVTSCPEKVEGLSVVKIGSKDQPVLAKPGDDIRIDWGYLYAAVPAGKDSACVLAPADAARQDFCRDGALKSDYGVSSEALPAGKSPMGVVTIDLGKVGSESASRWMMLAYDDLYSIQYMKANLRPYWRRNGWEAADLLLASAKDYASLKSRCAEFDKELMQDVEKAGGEKYAQICALAYRHCFAAGKFVADQNGQPISFCKENHSNGCIGTSDVFYPMAPQFLLFGPSLAKSFLVPFMNYAASDRWKFPFAPHDLGTYPQANGQRYGGGERTEENQMPVEETGNLLLLIAAVAQMEGNADFAGRYWPQLERWADYLRAKGFDPENQLCTDDFAGHLAHNVNLSAKAICGLGAFGKLCEMRGEREKADQFKKLAKEFAVRWVREADDGDHFRLGFDRPGTWSQKYNLVWDRILGLDLFPADVLRKELDYYRHIQNKYGLALDNRKTYTKLDWILWTATLTQDRKDFDALVEPVWRYLNEAPDRLPMSDWYWTLDAKKVGFTARPVVGGVFLQMLYDRKTWSKYASRDKTHAANWAPMPKPPRTVALVPTSEKSPQKWMYTTEKPDANWTAADFSDANWKEGTGGFGTRETPGAITGTVWSSSDIWLRRTFDLPEQVPGRLMLRIHHDEDAQVFVNGVQVLNRNGYTTDYEVAEIPQSGIAAFHAGRNVIAVHCHQTQGGQYIDVGVEAVVPEGK